MSWIKENKFLAALGGGTLAGVILLYVVGSQGASRYDTAKSEFDAAVAEAAGYEQGPLYPKPENRDAKRKAIEDYNLSLDLAKNNPDALHERCWSKAVLNTDLEGALADCNEALRLKPNDPETLGGRGFLYLRLGFLKTALLDYNAAIEGLPNKAEFHYGRATAKFRAGDQEGADSDFLTARALDPKIDEVFARIDEAGGGKGFWTAIADYWRSMLKWIY